MEISEYEVRHARRDARIERDREHLLRDFTPYALRQMAEDVDAPLPLGADPRDAWRTAQALARRLA